MNWRSYLEDRNKMFWLLQIAGWSGYALVQYMGSLMHEMREIWVVIVLLGAYAGFLLTVPMRYIYRSIWDKHPMLQIVVVVFCSYLAAALWAVIDNLTNWEIYKFGFRPTNLLFYFQLTVVKFYIMLTWSVLYFVIKYYQLLQDAQQKSLAAASMAHQSQLKMLRYQLNPHFLFNTLNAISTLILVNDTKGANQMMSKLSRFLRFSLDNEPIKRITLEQELSAAMLYLDIEKVRFGERLEVIVNVSEEAKKALVPSLILQPLIENAIKYAIAKTELVGRIEINGSVVEGQLLVTIADNGPDIFDATKVKIRGSGVGLVNTKERLKALYGKQFSFNLSANSPSGCIASLQIPWQVVER
ncbi:sensor histidine kinase [Aliidiomarina iranensis]|uniref:Sensor histidine kinase n=1 Tax=Aliidiomarina iranensis TaxID=1434071 RepID=A0A432W075_9GAMM|nr:histidine kinase [Aliidiomarina iranensis]RUO22416.1 sensor histidine kinase [Aliidiomarina iranensis]